MLKPLDFFLLRRPVGSIDSIERFHTLVKTNSLEHALRIWLTDPVAMEGLRLSSRSFHSRIEQWMNNGKVSEKDQLLLSLYRYFLRFSTRCTPFGTFAACAFGELAENTSIQFSPDDQLIFRITPDVMWQAHFGRMLSREMLIRNVSRIVGNSSIFQCNNAIRYIERQKSGSEAKHFLSSVEMDETVEIVLKHVSSGVTYPELINVLTLDGYESDEVIQYLDELFTNDIIELDLKPRVIGDSFAHRIIEILGPFREWSDVVSRLTAIDRHFIHGVTEVAKIPNIEKDLFEIGGHFKLDNYLKVDTYLNPIDNRLSMRVVNSIAEMLGELSHLNDLNDNSNLKEFKNKFRSRYDSLEIPLLKALDPDIGIVFSGAHDFVESGDNDLIDQLSIPEQKDSGVYGNLIWQDFILTKYHWAISAGNDEIEISKEDILRLKEKSASNSRNTFAHSCYAFGNLLADSQNEADRGNFLFNVLACQGPSAVHMMARFAVGQQKLYDEFKKCIELEQASNPEIIFAEVVHTPEIRAANIMTRPSLYRYEINYLGQGTNSEVHQILPSDLMVSVINDKIILRSKSLNRRIIPRVTNMHNARHGLPVYRFLNALQDQDSQFQVSWDWGVLSKQPFLPRIVYKKLILSRKSWHLRKSDLSNPDLQAFETYLTSRGIRDKVAIVEGDNELYIDVGVEISLRLMFHLFLKQETTKVVEFLSGQQSGFLETGSARYNNEVILPFTVSDNDKVSIPSWMINNVNVQTSFEPGSEWLYAKIYGSERTLDGLLHNEIPDFVQTLRKLKRIQNFFYVRFVDTDSHLRLRFQCLDGHTALSIVDELRIGLAAHIKTQLIYKVQIDTYQREALRYGWDKVSLFERHFSFESDLLMNLFFSNGTILSQKQRFSFALRYVMEVLEDLSLDDKASKEFCQKQRDNFLKEFSVSPLIFKKISAFVKGSLDSILSHAHQIEENEFLGASSFLKTFFTYSECEAHQLASVFHMMVNRMFQSKQRKHELVLYHILTKIYESKIARNQLNGNPFSACAS